MSNELKCPEVWADVAGYEGLYKVSNLGAVCRVDKNRHKILNTRLRSGYPSVRLTKFCKTVDALVHRLVAIAFIPNPENKCDVNHKNGIKTDNRVENLEWVSCSENISHSYKLLNHKKVKSMLGKYGDSHCRAIPVIRISNQDIKEYKSIIEAAQDNNANSSNIVKCCKGKQKTCCGFKWEYSKMVEHNE